MFTLEWVESDGEVKSNGPFWTAESAVEWCMRNLEGVAARVLPVERNSLDVRYSTTIRAAELVNGHKEGDGLDCWLKIGINGKEYIAEIGKSSVRLWPNEQKGSYDVFLTHCTCDDWKYRGRQRPCKHMVACRQLGLLGG